MSTIPSSNIVTADCRHGRMLWPRSDRVIGRSLALYGEFAEGENRVMSRFVAPGDTVIDVGANLGATVLALAKATGAGGTLLAFEPQPLMAQLLQTTLTLNDCFHVRVIPAALADRSGWSRIAAPGLEAGGNYGAMALSREGLQVPVFRLDDLEISTCALVKIDVEGFEWPVLQGARGHLLRHRPVLYLEAKRIPGTINCLLWLMENGWHCYWHFAMFYNADNFRRNTANVFAGAGDMNVLAVPAGGNEPADLPQIRTPEEDWQKVYADFYRERDIPFP